MSRVSDIVRKSNVQQNKFRSIGHGLQDLENKTGVKVASNVLSGVKNVVDAKHLLSLDLAAKCNLVTNTQWSKATHWVRWWPRDRILKMFSRAFSLRNKEDGDATLDTNNPVESLHRQSIGVADAALLQS